MMKIKNPLDKDLNLCYKGTDYVLEAGVTKSFEADVAAHWILIYGFLSLGKNSDKEVDEVVEEVEKAKKPEAKKPAKKAAKKKGDKKE